MSVEEELRGQKDFLALPTTRWRRGTPAQKNEACMVYRHYGVNSGLGYSGLGLVAMSLPALQWLARWMKHRNDPNGPRHIPIGWNDSCAKSKEQVIEMLEKAIAAAGEEGV